MKTRIFITLSPDGGIDYDIAGNETELANILKTVAHYDKHLRQALNSLAAERIQIISELANAFEPSVGAKPLSERHKPADNE